jgi:thymidylate synthase
MMGNNIGEAYRKTLMYIRNYGQVSSPRGMRTKELIAQQVTILDMQDNILTLKKRDLNFRFMVAEWLWIEAGANDVNFISRYNKNISQFSDDGVIFNGAYGPRLAPQWKYILESLSKPDSRQAVATIWTPSPQASKDIPCTVAFQFLSREGRLHMIATMRSSDAWLGLPYDIFNFSMIGNGIAGEMGLKPGSLTMQLGSLHLYEQHWDIAGEVIDETGSGFLRSPELKHRPAAQTMIDFASGTYLSSSLYGQPRHAPYIDVLQSKTKLEALGVLREASKLR